ncbi:MAG: hypothetical protein ACRDGA_01845 [Bacteroidota bacterium]
MSLAYNKLKKVANGRWEATLDGQLVGVGETIREAVAQAEEAVWLNVSDAEDQPE